MVKEWEEFMPEEKRELWNDEKGSDTLRNMLFGFSQKGDSRKLAPLMAYVRSINPSVTDSWHPACKNVYFSSDLYEKIFMELQQNMEEDRELWKRDFELKHNW